MLKDSPTFSGYSVKDLDEAKAFYNEKLGVEVEQDAMGLKLKTASGNEVFLYQKDDHQPATFTVLNFVVEDIDSMIDGLATNGVVFEQYDFGNGAKTDEKGVMRGKAANMGPDIAWLKDPSGNIVSILSN